MLRVNFKEILWEEGLTVEGLLHRIKDDRAYVFILRGRVSVIVNDEVVPPPEYGAKKLQDGDNVRIYPAIAGG